MSERKGMGETKGVSERSSQSMTLDKLKKLNPNEFSLRST